MGNLLDCSVFSVDLAAASAAGPQEYPVAPTAASAAPSALELEPFSRDF